MLLRGIVLARHAIRDKNQYKLEYIWMALKKIIGYLETSKENYILNKQIHH